MAAPPHLFALALTAGSEASFSAASRAFPPPTELCLGSLGSPQLYATQEYALLADPCLAPGVVSDGIDLHLGERPPLQAQPALNGPVPVLEEGQRPPAKTLAHSAHAPAPLSTPGHPSAAALFYRAPAEPPRAVWAGARQAEVSAEDAAVRASCQTPGLRSLLRYFPGQQPALACADRLNARLPPWPRPVCRLASGGPWVADQEDGARERESADHGARDGCRRPRLGSSDSLAAPSPPSAPCSESAEPAPSAPPRQIFPPDLAQEWADARAAVREALEACRRAARLQRALLAEGAAPAATPAPERVARDRGVAAESPHSETCAALSDGGEASPPRESEASRLEAEVCQTLVEARQPDVHVFCVETRGRDGAPYRRFACASHPAVWAAYRASAPLARHWYEVVREGRPCHLYLDLEFCAVSFPRADGNGLVDAVLRALRLELERRFGLAAQYESQLLELDSSSATKFSRHLVLRLPGLAWATNAHLGRFVRQVVRRAGEAAMLRGDGGKGGGDGDDGRGFRLEQPPAQSLTQRSHCIVDTSVYSRNRHFRLPWSCKAGKTAVLVPTARFAARGAAEGSGAVTSADVFLRSLVCRVDPGSELLLVPADGSERGAPGGRVERLGLRGRPGAAAKDPQILLTWRRHPGEPALSEPARRALQALATRTMEHVESVASERAGGRACRARTMSFCGTGGAVSYSMLGPGSHYCQAVGRDHCKNRVYYQVDLAAGTMSQRCHDPDCRAFKSDWLPLPPELHWRWQEHEEQASENERTAQQL